MIILSCNTPKYSCSPQNSCFPDLNVNFRIHIYLPISDNFSPSCLSNSIHSQGDIKTTLLHYALLTIITSHYTGYFCLFYFLLPLWIRPRKGRFESYTEWFIYLKKRKKKALISIFISTFDQAKYNNRETHLVTFSIILYRKFHCYRDLQNTLLTYG